MKTTSLKFKIPFTILAFALSSVLITAILIQNVTSNHIKEDILKKNMVISDMLNKHIYSYIQNAKETVDTAANFAWESYENSGDIKTEIFRIYDNFEYFDLIFFLDTEGNMLFSKPVNEEAYLNYNYSDRDYFQGVMDNKTTYISNLHMSRVLNQLHFIIASPVLDKDNNIVGIIGAGIPLSNIKKIIEEVQENFDGNIYIVDELGTLLVHPNIDKITDFNRMENFDVHNNKEKITMFDIMKNKKNVLIDYQKENKNYHSIINFIEEVDWMIIAEQEEEAVLKEIILLKKQLKSITFILVIVTLIIGLVFAHRTSKPIENLVKEVRKLGDSEENVNFIEIQSNDEIGELALAFNDMSIKLNNNLNRLKESYARENYFRQYLDNILKSLGSGIIVIDGTGIITVFNSAAVKITGYSKTDYIGKHINEFFSSINLSIDKFTEKVWNKEEENIVLERVILKKDNDSVPINISISPVINDRSEIIGIIYLFNDISQAKKMEQELNKLDRIHILGELSSALIHDIGNPLAGMSNLLELLDNNWQNEEMKEQIFNMLNNEIKDLNELVIKFLSLSNDTSLDKEPINIIELIEEVLNILKPEFINKNIHLTKKYIVPKDYTIDINKANIKRAFINIIINCVQAVDENGNILILVTTCKNNVLIKIEDDGVGIDEKNIKKIFEPFYTTKKHGTGLGLSSTYKIIKEHGGNISVESKKNEGTVFLVKL
ncbi:PAS domain S-box protein [Anaerosalibacter bizertensis]|uniref:PAS domain-containing sensor histidine kinase n=1 Tax=Anaerosalibacter bizertensis TaxID=932217 RepID=UPI001C0F0F93|nr:PAS domain-containing sensor histidine kinase [Anaerosalibacter bizertensis]MBU5294379.1 PAS domain S-box protein [Anaerosalibacter bizertensis]